MSKLSKSVQEFIDYRKKGLLPPGTRVTTYEDLLNSDRIKKIRKRTGLAQWEFAQKLHLSLNTYRKWEQGVRRPEGPGRVLLVLVESDPKGVFATLEAAQTMQQVENYKIGKDGKKPAAKKPTVRKAPAKRVLAKKPTVPKKTTPKKTVAKKARTTRRKSAARPPTPRGVAA